MKEQTNGERFEEFMNSVQYPELEGTNALCDDIIKSREISDEEIEMAALLNEPRVTRRAFRSGAKWYREQLKKK